MFVQQSDLLLILFIFIPNMFIISCAAPEVAQELPVTNGYFGQRL